jgi:molybdopterin-containing oxidoreductase family membrane subunit
MAAERRIMGLFSDPDQVVAAIADLRQGPWALRDVRGPIPHHGIAAALGLKKSRVGWYTLAGGIIGFFSGFALAAYCAGQWNLIVSGKPVVALVPFFIVGFEFTILFSVLGNVVGLLNEARLPDLGAVKPHEPPCTGDRYGLVAGCSHEAAAGLEAFFRSRGAAEVSILA